MSTFSVEGPASSPPGGHCAAWVPETTSALEGWLDELRPFAGERRADPARLLDLFGALRGIGFGEPVKPAPRMGFGADECTALDRMLGDLQAPLAAGVAAGLFGNPWAAAALRRDEVRNASVLAWFLDPSGGHGCGDALLS